MSGLTFYCPFHPPPQIVFLHFSSYWLLPDSYIVNVET
jgi:hypothetical protein